MDGVFLAGRILFALVFVMSGANHLSNPRAMAGYVRSRGVPAALPATIASGVYLVAAGLMVAIGIWLDLAGLMIAAFTVSTAFLVHHFWTDDEAQRQQTMVNHLKDLALAGAGLALFALFAGFGDDIGLTVTGPAFDL
jgi:putative oxidoreductase